MKVLSEKALFTDQEKLEMKIVEKTESREKCAEAGWFAWDCLMDHKINREFILSLKPLGDLCIWICSDSRFSKLKMIII